MLNYQRVYDVYVWRNLTEDITESIRTSSFHFVPSFFSKLRMGQEQVKRNFWRILIDEDPNV